MLHHIIPESMVHGLNLQPYSRINSLFTNCSKLLDYKVTYFRITNAV